MLYRILTENKNKAKLLALVATRFPGFTVIEAVGYWCGKPEKSLIIEVMASASEVVLIEQLASAIQELNNQEAVLIQTIKVTKTFTGRS